MEKYNLYDNARKTSSFIYETQHMRLEDVEKYVINIYFDDVERHIGDIHYDRELGMWVKII